MLDALAAGPRSADELAEELGALAAAADSAPCLDPGPPTLAEPVSQVKPVWDRLSHVLHTAVNKLLLSVKERHKYLAISATQRSFVQNPRPARGHAGSRAARRGRHAAAGRETGFPAAVPQQCTVHTLLDSNPHSVWPMVCSPLPPACAPLFACLERCHAVCPGESFAKLASAVFHSLAYNIWKNWVLAGVVHPGTLQARWQSDVSKKHGPALAGGMGG